MLHKIEIDDRIVIYGNDRFLEEFKQAFLKEIQEYNTDTSAGHPIKDDDIVRYSEETQRIQDKELEH